MSALSRLRSLWRGLARRSSFEAEMDEEFRLHLELRTEDLIRSGLPPAEAARRARLEFGSAEVHKERARASLGLRIFDEVRGDVRYGVRTLLRTPGFTVVAVLTLALGIGATTTIFSVLDAVMIRPLPFRDAGRLVELDGVGIGGGNERRHGPSLTLADVRSLPVFQRVVAYAAGGLNLSSGGMPERIAVAEVTPGFFETLGVRPVLGRAFAPEEGVPHGPHVAIVSRALWRERLGGDTVLVGARITLNGSNYQVVGVAPRSFAFPAGTDVWIPMSVPWTAASYGPFAETIPYTVVGRLCAGVTLEDARARVASLFEAYGSKARSGLFAPRVAPLRATLVGDRRTALLMLLGATTLVLLIACANVANLVLSRATVRWREIALRATLGATPGRVARQLLLEGVLLAVFGAGVGTGMAISGTRYLGSLVPSVLVGSTPLRVDASVLMCALALALGTGLVLGLVPSLSTRRSDAGEVLKNTGTGTTTGAAPSRLRRGLLLAEVALTVMLLTGSGVMLRSLDALLSTDTGLKPQHVATLQVTLAGSDYRSTGAERLFYERVVQELDAAPDVEAAAWVNELPLGTGQMGFTFSMYPAGRSPAREDEERRAELLAVTQDYFRSMGIQILRGRAPRASADTTRPRFAEAAVNERLARRWWQGQATVGKRLELVGGVTLDVVGVVANVRQTSLSSGLVPQAYVPFLQRPYRNAALVARGTMPVSDLERRLVQAVHDVAPEQAVYDVRTMDDVIARAIEPRRLNTALITAFSVLALVLAAVGVYGVIAFGVARRTQEIGIRMALGANAGQIRRSVLGEALGVALSGCVLGLGGAWALSRVLRSFVYGVSPTDPVSFAVAPLIVLAVAALAAFVPARRATRIDPTEAIREA